MLGFSFFGPRNGRLLYGKFNVGGTLEIRASKIYDFWKLDDAPFDLFVRYYGCTPRYSPKYEFGEEEEDIPGPVTDKKRKTPLGTTENVPAKRQAVLQKEESQSPPSAEIGSD